MIRATFVSPLLCPLGFPVVDDIDHREANDRAVTRLLLVDKILDENLSFPIGEFQTVLVRRGNLTLRNDDLFVLLARLALSFISNGYYS